MIEQMNDQSLQSPNVDCLGASSHIPKTSVGSLRDRVVEEISRELGPRSLKSPKFLDCGRYLCSQKKLDNDSTRKELSLKTQYTCASYEANRLCMLCHFDAITKRVNILWQ